VGDKVLREVASRLAGAVREADTVARLGGDEFAVICEHSDRRAAEAVADRIHRALGEPIDVDGHSFAVGASIGVAVSPPLNSTELLRRADVAMYQAKEGGGAATVVFGA
jgi:diguanylate cyclase (GGDEF)-like protein